MGFSPEDEERLKLLLQRQTAREGAGAGTRTMDFGSGVREDVAQYLHVKHPGTQPLRMQADPYCILKDGEAHRKRWPFKATRTSPEVPEFVWRKREDRYTVALVHRGDLKPVFEEEVDMGCPDAVFDVSQVPTPSGIKRQVSLDGLCLYRISQRLAENWFKQPVDYYKGEQARMVYDRSDNIRKQGYEAINSRTGEGVGSNMAVKDIRAENPMDDRA